MKTINYNLLLSSNELNDLGLKKITSIKNQVNNKVGKVDLTGKYTTSNTNIYMTPSEFRESAAKEAIYKTANKDLTNTEKLLLGTNIVYYNDQTFDELLSMCKINETDINQIVMTIDTVKSLNNELLGLKNRYKLLTKSFLSKTKKSFDLKKDNKDIEDLNKEINSTSSQLREIKSLINSLEEKLNAVQIKSTEFLNDIYESKLKLINKFYTTKNMYWVFNKVIEKYALENINCKTK